MKFVPFLRSTAKALLVDDSKCSDEYTFILGSKSIGMTFDVPLTDSDDGNGSPCQTLQK